MDTVSVDNRLVSCSAHHDDTHSEGAVFRHATLYNHTVTQPHQHEKTHRHAQVQTRNDEYTNARNTHKGKTKQQTEWRDNTNAETQTRTDTHTEMVVTTSVASSLVLGTTIALQPRLPQQSTSPRTARLDVFGDWLPSDTCAHESVVESVLWAALP